MAPDTPSSTPEPLPPSGFITTTLWSHIVSLDGMEYLSIKLGRIEALPSPQLLFSAPLCLCDLFLGAQIFQYKNGPCFFSSTQR